MTTEAELGQAAVDIAQETTISWDEYLRRTATDKNYAYKKAKWYAAGGKLEEAKHLPPPTPPPTDYLAAARGRIFLADDPLSCVRGGAPKWMVPVVTADSGYPDCQDPNVIAQLIAYFGSCEVWCDCHTTFFPTALKLIETMRTSHGITLSGAWGECESQAAFDNGYNAGARRFVGKIDASVVGNPPTPSAPNWRWDAIASAHVLVTVEQYLNCSPNQVPDWRNLNAGIGGNCPATYKDAECTADAPISLYKSKGIYVPKQGSVYAGGSPKPVWTDLA